MTGREGDLARPVAFPHIPFQNMKHCPAPLVSPNLDFSLVCVRKPLEHLALCIRFPLLFFLQLAGMVLANSSIDIAHDTF